MKDLYSFNDYQRDSELTAVYPRTGFDGICYTALGANSEAGEIAGKVKKAMRDNNCQISESQCAAIADEIGDALWYLSQLCTELHLSLEQIAKRNIEKLQDRMARGTIKGGGDNR